MNNDEWDTAHDANDRDVQTDEGGEPLEYFNKFTGRWEPNTPDYFSERGAE